MSDFSSESHFAQQNPRRQALCLFRSEGDALPPPSQIFHDEVRVAKQELERWYAETNDLVRSLGLGTSSGRAPRRDAQKRAQKDSSGGGEYDGGGSLPVGEIHDRLTDLRDQMYRYVR